MSGLQPLQPLIRLENRPIPFTILLVARIELPRGW